ncbi:hypothetical protein NDU88_002454 [Pleurodeles waltl]|uniref:Uncharacterized protein n=1 Tax=Pleurodeles waltl TaxID=8319 RepID=A0AAV7M3E2_PLEWA|nr:hypothetical protein NDU88_002454 [Pleurodeles waltl]
MLLEFIALISAGRADKKSRCRIQGRGELGGVVENPTSSAGTLKMYPVLRELITLISTGKAGRKTRMRHQAQEVLEGVVQGLASPDEL